LKFWSFSISMGKGELEKKPASTFAPHLSKAKSAARAPNERPDFSRFFPFGRKKLRKRLGAGYNRPGPKGIAT
jgi:hypothetical protein